MHKGKGFTLIEVLVVIAVIGLLLGVLLPALQRAKEQAKAAVCLGHLKGVGFATQTYIADYDSIYPPYRSDAMPPPHGKPSSFTDPYGITYARIHRYALLTCWYSPGNNNDPARDGDGYLGPYVGTSDGGLWNILSCPSMQSKPKEVILTMYHAPSPRYAYKSKSYCLNLWDLNLPNWDNLKAWPASDIKRPAELVYMCDSPARELWTVGKQQYYTEWEGFTAIVPMPRHRNHSVFNMNFYDGHADSGAMDEFYNKRHFENTPAGPPMSVWSW